MNNTSTIKAIIGLGNPGPRFAKTRHNIGFRIVDELVNAYHGMWALQGNFLYAEILVNDRTIIVIKPQTFMNDSGQVIPKLAQWNIEPQNILVIHDELELPFGQMKVKLGGSHRGHNGLRSIIQCGGKEFTKLSFGIGRPVNKEEVPNYVLTPFTESEAEIKTLIDKAVEIIEKTITDSYKDSL